MTWPWMRRSDHQIAMRLCVDAIEHLQAELRKCRPPECADGHDCFAEDQMCERCGKVEYFVPRH